MTSTGEIKVGKRSIMSNLGCLLTPSSLIKMLYWMCKKSGLPPTWPQLEHAICRNFGGMESDELDPLEEFKQWIHIRGVPDLQSIPQEVRI